MCSFVHGFILFWHILLEAGCHRKVVVYSEVMLIKMKIRHEATTEAAADI